jgi:exonuclease SbcC
MFQHLHPADRSEVFEELHESEQQALVQHLGVENLAELEAKLADTQQNKKLVEGTIERLKREQSATEKKLESAREILRKIQEYEDAKVELKGLEDKREVFAQKEERLEKARKASTLADVESEWRRRGEELDEKRKRLEEARKSVVRAQEQKAEADEQAGRITSLEKELDPCASG